MRSVPWTAKYAPRSLGDVHGQHAAAQQLRDYVEKHTRGKICLLYGRQGVGKTSMVHALARDLDAELLELNASDVRNESAITQVLGPALQQQSLFGRRKIILFDEADGLSGTKDRGGLAALLDLVAKTPFPIILTANDPWDRRFNALRRKAVLVHAHALPYTSIVPVLRRIADAEGVTYTDEALKSLARRAGGDLRAAITDLQSVAPDVTQERVDSLTQRDTVEGIVDALRVVLKTRDPAVARRALDAVQEDLDQIMLWLDANLPKEYRKPADLRRAYEALSRADVFRGRIRRWQHWRFLVYCYDLLGPGVALAKREKYDGFVQLGPTQRLFAIWRSRSATRDAVIAKLAKEQHTSARVARQSLRLLKPVLADADFLDEVEQAWVAQKA